MTAGVIASQPLPLLMAAAEGDADLGLVPLAVFDFENDIYTIGETSLVVADVIDLTGRVTVDLGLSIEEEAPVELLGDALDLVKVSNFTMVIHLNILTLSAGVTHEILYASGSLDSDEIYLTQFVGYAELYDLAEEVYSDMSFDFGERNLFDDPDPTIVVGDANIIALTRTAAQLAFCGNGGVVQVDTTLLDFPMDIDSVKLASWVGAGPTIAGYIQKIEVYEPQPSSYLIPLSS